MAKKIVVRPRTQEQILADNAKYNALPPMKKRVATAKEILAEISIGIFVPNDGYGVVTIPGVHEPGTRPMCFPAGNLQMNMEQKGFQCEGCAKAAVIVARARLGNAVHVTSYTSNSGLAHNVSFEIFGEKCANMIEAIYEMYDNQLEDVESTFFIESRTERKAVQEYMRALPSREGKCKERMVAIYQNIIDNRGRLVVGGYKY